MTFDNDDDECTQMYPTRKSKTSLQIIICAIRNISKSIERPSISVTQYGVTLK